jgi:hypothetical protein
MTWPVQMDPAPRKHRTYSEWLVTETGLLDEAQQAEAVELLRKAKGVLAVPYGWCKGTSGPGVCAVGGLRIAAGGANGMAETNAALMLDLIAGERGAHDAVEYNDLRRTGKHDVLSLFDEAIRRFSA